MNINLDNEIIEKIKIIKDDFVKKYPHYYINCDGIVLKKNSNKYSCRHYDNNYENIYYAIQTIPKLYTNKVKNNKNNKEHSYCLKHIIEKNDWYPKPYLSNGDLIIAMLYLGFQFNTKTFIKKDFCFLEFYCKKYKKFPLHSKYYRLNENYKKTKYTEMTWGITKVVLKPKMSLDCINIVEKYLF